MANEIEEKSSRIAIFKGKHIRKIIERIQVKIVQKAFKTFQKPKTA